MLDKLRKFMEIQFSKYHGLGNDYIVIDPNKTKINLNTKTIKLICHRNYGIGSDGILYGPIVENNILGLKIFNPDGSEAEKSGNGLRIFAKYLFENKYVKEKNFDIKTLGGVVKVEIKDDSANLIKINMGKVTFISDEIPVKGEKREVVNETIKINGGDYKVTCLSIGNPHCVIPMDNISEEKAKELGPYVENHELFPNRINMQILKVINRSTVEIQIWERGAGYTLASGSSSCAAASAAFKLGLVDKDIKVKMPGGALQITIGDSGEVYMTGSAQGICEGSFRVDSEYIKNV
jgi:diaminopimelate epimerase